MFKLKTINFKNKYSKQRNKVLLIKLKEPKQNDSTPAKEMGDHFLHFIM